MKNNTQNQLAGEISKVGSVSLDPAFYTDRDVARKLNLSQSWVRVQRLKRKRGEEHILTVDARYIGRCARYVAGEIDAFIAALVE